MKNKTLIFILLMIFSAGAQAMNAEELITKCKKSLQSTPGETANETTSRILDAGSCAGFVSGVASGISLVSGMMMQQGIVEKNLFCLPKGLDAQKMLGMVEQEINRNSASKKQAAQFVIYNVLQTKYPCP